MFVDYELRRKGKQTQKEGTKMELLVHSVADIMLSFLPKKPLVIYRASFRCGRYNQTFFVFQPAFLETRKCSAEISQLQLYMASKYRDTVSICYEYPVVI